MKKNLFTLIELISIVTILAFLAFIITQRVQLSETKEDASLSSIKMNLTSFQTASDKYASDHYGQFPSKTEPTLFSPSEIDFNKLYPKYVKSLSKFNEVKYWVDYQGKVWSSTASLPTNLKEEDGKLKWSASPNATEYQLFLYEEQTVTGKASHYSLKELPATTKETFTSLPAKGKLLVSAIDKFGFRTAPVGIPLPSSPESSPKGNEKPIAVISVTPAENIHTNTVLQWGYELSTDPNGDKIVDAEWVNQQSTYSTVGEHIISLRVKDEQGTWSDWVSKTILVTEPPNQAPIAVLSLTPDGDIYTDTTLNWSSSNSYDPDGDNIINEEWENKEEIYSKEGTYKVRLRVQDEKGLWSEWVEKDIIVKRHMNPPNAVISYTPKSNLDTNTVFTWSAANSFDIDKDEIVSEEWRNKRSTYEAGAHKVELRVQDSTGLWSDWVGVVIAVSTPNEKPIAQIYMNPSSNITTKTNIEWSSSSSYDPNGDNIISEEWENKQTIYSEGTKTVRLRVQDEHGLWSDWTEITFTVAASNDKPVAVIKMGSDSVITDQSVIRWSSGSYDPDGDAIIAEEWQNKKDMYSSGSQTVKLRVQDAKGIWSDWTSETFTVTHLNHEPIAIISMSPDLNITPSTTIYWASDESYDIDRDSIQNAEWVNKQSTYPVGTHTVKLRVQDSHGLWGNWSEVTFKVMNPNSPPTAVISMTPANPKTTDTITWSHSSSTDPDGNRIVDADWIDMRTNYSEAGIYKVGLRVQDEHGAWSPIVYKNFTVTAPTSASNTAPVAKITALVDNVNTGFPNTVTIIDTMHHIQWVHNTSTDADGDKIINAEWVNALDIYPTAGTYTVQLRVQDEHGTWSAWTNKTFTVNRVAQKDSTRYDTNRAPNAVITMTPDAITNKDVNAKTQFAFSSASSTDPDGDKIVKEEWKGVQPKYTIGTYVVELRVQDHKGMWSNWVSKTFTIGNRKPVAIIDMTPNTYIQAAMNVDWSSARSFDPDGDKIIQEVWAGKQKNYPDGHVYSVKMKVRDNHGLWSDWACKKIVVGNGGPQRTKYEDCDGTSNGTGVKVSPPEEYFLKTYYMKSAYCFDSTKPCATNFLEYDSVDGEIYEGTVLNWRVQPSVDSNGHQIVETRYVYEDTTTGDRILVSESDFMLNFSTLSAGNHLIGVMVKNSQGVWSEISWLSLKVLPSADKPTTGELEQNNDLPPVQDEIFVPELPPGSTNPYDPYVITDPELPPLPPTEPPINPYY